MGNSIFIPFVVFFIVIAVVTLQTWAMSIISAHGKESQGKRKSYACGEDYNTNKVNPEYSQFFPFAFFFTIMHVVAMILATVPSGKLDFSALGIAYFYLVTAIVALFVLFRR